ncbi:MFS transporter [Haloarcula onubensis]|uniref:MFS transporter n=1 Tax=Haloarcula onubensis TaxID=2950539 RepID=A0ABU2FJ00_9EURY|nr:MFS transporter [Halomicroarcula sp. S3CR25-11]MDS0280707.1 MFS transporter [Halomicroarcula sp. S3CR25-11]
MDEQEQRIGDVIEGIAVGRFHWLLVATVGGTWAAMSISILAISFTLPTFIDIWNLSGLTAGVLGSASLLGMLVGNTVGGWYADRVGRKRTLVIAIVTFSVFTALTGFAVGLYSAIGLRFLTGIGLGGALVSGTSYLAEHLPSHVRGRYITYLEASYSVGAIAVVALAWAVLSVLGGPDGTVGGVAAWRVFFGAGIVPLGLAVVAVRVLPPSPYFLARQGRTAAATAALEAIAVRNRVEPPSVSGPWRVVEPDEMGYRRLLTPELRGTTVLLASLWVVVNVAFYGIFTWLPDTVAAAGYTDDLYRFLFVVTLFQLLGQLGAAYLIELVGRKWTLGGFTILGGAGTLLFAAAIPGAGVDIGAARTTVFLLGLFVMGFAVLGAWAVLYAYTSEVFPTEVRSTGLGLTGSVGKVAAVAGPVLFGALSQFGYLVTLAPVAVSLFLAGLALLLRGAETKGETLL